MLTAPFTWPRGTIAMRRDGWHFTYLRRQANMAAIVFDGALPVHYHSLNDLGMWSTPMSVVRTVKALDTGTGCRWMAPTVMHEADACMLTSQS